MTEPLQIVRLTGAEKRTVIAGIEVPYDYRVDLVRRVVDGDTIDLQIDMGMNVFYRARVRVLYLNTPEKGKPGYAQANSYVTVWLNVNADALRIETFKHDSFGRWLAKIYNVLTGEMLHVEVIEFMAGLGIDSHYVE